MSFSAARVSITWTTTGLAFSMIICHVPRVVVDYIIGIHFGWQCGYSDIRLETGFVAQQTACVKNGLFFTVQGLPGELQALGGSPCRLRHQNQAQERCGG